MRYLTITGMCSGTGLRDTYTGEYLDPSELGLSQSLSDRVSQWLEKSRQAHFGGYSDQQVIEALDAEGLELCKDLSLELPDSKIGYFSDARAETLLWS